MIGSDVGGYRTKTVQAGEYLYVSCYPLLTYNADRVQRSCLMNDLPEDRIKNARIRQRYNRYNNKRRIQEFEQLVHANLVRGDLHIACTYEVQDPDRPDLFEYRDREQARREIRNYINRIKYMLQKRKCDLSQFRWICVTVTKEADPEAFNPLPERHHHHLLVHGIPEELRNDVERLWTYGYCNADRLQESNEGFAAMAGYISRQESSANGENCGKRSYSTSKNIIKPTVRTSDSRISRRRAAMIAADVQVAGREIFEKLFEGYRLVEEVRTDVSNFVAGAYIYARLRRKKEPTFERRRRNGKNH